MPDKPSPFIKSMDAILSAHSLETEIQAAKELAKSYQGLISQLKVEENPYDQKTATNLDGGTALSSRHALDCLDDPLRTVRFIAGTYAAVQDALTIFSDRPIQILYAGCGPGAPLILPFLHEFDSAEISVTLLDITPSSLASVKELVDHLGLADYIRSYELQDAITYKHPEELGLHFVVSETMDKGLTREPQVRITQNLAPQLSPDGILVPKAIEIYAEHTFYGNEPYFDIYKKHEELPPYWDAKDTEHLFTIDKNIATDEPFWFESQPRATPKDYKEIPDISVYAKVKIYNDLVLEKSQSLLSNPYCVKSFYNVNSPSYKLKHTTSGTPQWEVIEVPS